MKGKVSCLNTRALIAYVRARKPESINLLWEPLQGKLSTEEDPESFLSNSKNHISVQAFRDVMEQVKKLTSDEMAVYRAALEHGCQREFVSSRFRFMRPLFGTKHVIRKAQEMYAKFLAGKRIEIIVASNTHSIVRLYWSEGLPLTRDFCLFAKGIYQTMPMMLRLPPARLWESVCFFENGPYCEYEMWWDKKPTRKMFPVKPASGNGDLWPSRELPQKALGHIGTKHEGTASSYEHPLGKPVNQNRTTDRSTNANRGGKVVTQPANGIAHKFNTLFAGMQKYISLILTEIDSRHPHFEHLKEMETMIKSGANLSKQYLGRTKDGDRQSRITDKNKNNATKQGELATQLLRGTETILIVDNEHMVLNVGQQMLETMGYKVMVATTGKQAIEIYKKNIDDIDMVLLDMITPDMRGGETYYRMKEINPEIKVLLSSGYNIDTEARLALARGCKGFLQKPFSMKQLSEKIRAILDNKPSH